MTKFEKDLRFFLLERDSSFAFLLFFYKKTVFVPNHRCSGNTKTMAPKTRDTFISSYFPAETAEQKQARLAKQMEQMPKKKKKEGST